MNLTKEKNIKSFIKKYLLNLLKLESEDFRVLNKLSIIYIFNYTQIIFDEKHLILLNINYKYCYAISYEKVLDFIKNNIYSYAENLLLNLINLSKQNKLYNKYIFYYDMLSNSYNRTLGETHHIYTSDSLYSDILYIFDTIDEAENNLIQKTNKKLKIMKLYYYE